MKNLDISKWNTYAHTGYTHDVANDRRSQGGVHQHQVRRTKSGTWQYRIEQTQGRFSAFGPVTPISATDGEARFARAQN